MNKRVFKFLTLLVVLFSAGEVFAELVQHLRVNDWHTLRSTPIDGLLLRILEAILLSSGAIIKKKAHKYVFVNI